MADTNPLVTSAFKPRQLSAAIVGGGQGCKSFLQMMQNDRVGPWRLNIRGVADIHPNAPGILYAKEIGVELVTNDYNELLKASRP